ncbi:MAG: hypothetical protein ACMXYC_00375 [Candidatus Woesearchaeota archaeon]
MKHKYIKLVHRSLKTSILKNNMKQIKTLREHIAMLIEKKYGEQR